MRIPPRILAIALLAIVVAVVLVHQPEATGPGGGPGSPTSTVSSSKPIVHHVRTALIYDSLSTEFPNDNLIANLTETLESHGVRVTVVRGYNATLDWLVAMGRYDLVIIRAHGAYNGDPDSGKPLGPYIYTGMTDGLAYALYDGLIDEGLRKGYFAFGVIPVPGVPLEDLTRYLTVSPLYVREQVGRMNGTIVVYSGCYGFTDDRLAEAFISRGASYFIGWDGNVTLTFSDYALEEIVSSLASHEWNVEAALTAINKTISRDPATGAVLKVEGVEG